MVQQLGTLDHNLRVGLCLVSSPNDTDITLICEMLHRPSCLGIRHGLGLGRRFYILGFFGNGILSLAFSTEITMQNNVSAV